MAPKGFLAFVKAEHGLEGRLCIRGLWHVMDECVVDAITNRSFEGLVQDSPPADSVQFTQLGFEICYVVSRPILHDGSVQAAKLRYVEERPCALNHRWTGRRWQSVLQRRPQV